MQTQFRVNISIATRYSVQDNVLTITSSYYIEVRLEQFNVGSLTRDPT
jgi:hypothetical protein